MYNNKKQFISSNNETHDNKFKTGYLLVNNFVIL